MCGDGGHGVVRAAEEEGHGWVEHFELFVVFGIPSAVDFEREGRCALIFFAIEKITKMSKSNEGRCQKMMKYTMSSSITNLHDL